MHVVPQPFNKLVTLLNVPKWAVDMLLTPILIQILRPAGTLRFAELLPGHITLEDIRDATGWPPGARVFVGGAMSALEEDEVLHLRPGTLVL